MRDSSASFGSNALIALFLILGVLLPTGCVLWFMNDAATSQAAAARQSVTEAYRNQLPLLRDRVESYWQARTANLTQQLGPRAGESPASAFARAIRSGAADAILTPLYPPPPPPFNPDVKPDLALAAGQSQIRTYLQFNNKPAALEAIQRYFLIGPLSSAHDPQGRLTAADEQLLAIHLQPTPARIQHLAALLNDYDHVTIPPAQRLFLMDELRTLDPSLSFPTQEAERLAQQYQATNTAPPDTWQLPWDRQRPAEAIALDRTATIQSLTQSLLDQQTPSKSVRFTLLPPDSSSSSDSIQAGPLFPTWRLSFTLLDTKPLDEAARARRASYLYAGFLTIAAMILTGALTTNVFRRQLRLARLKTDLVAAVSHELKTPLASMRLLVDNLLDDPAHDPVKTREYLELIAGENHRLTRLIENFLTFSRIERNRQRFDFVPLDPAELIQTAAQLMRERLQPPQCRFEIETAPGLPQLQADEDALVTVLLNLIDNAYKYTPSDRKISVRARHASASVIFEVADNGIGIAPRDQKRIFRRFYRVDQRLARETQGCGLGLSIVDFIVKAHGGRVTVQSHPGQGSTFKVTLPVAVGQAHGLRRALSPPSL
ncbi:MAG TPA: HAMP domain-containing sensor histidine kinase [Bryobacteraceae bacterium]|jgi:signal transduction histidine kinase